MNTQSQDTQSSFAWNKLNLTDSSSWATAVCKDHNDRIYVATWNGSSGHIYGLASDGKSWDPLSATLTDTVNSMCSDSLGNVYAVAGLAAKQYGLLSYNGTGQFTPVPGSAQSFPINTVCADGVGNIYMTGNFVDANNNICVMQYNVQKTSWANLTGGEFPSALIDLCADSSGVVYALGLNSVGIPYVSYYSGGAWSSKYASQNLDSSTLGMACDNSGNVYLPSSTTVWSFNTGSNSYTNMNAPMPATAPTAVYLRWVDNVLYVVGYSYGTSLSCFALAYGVPATGWNEIIPSVINNGSTSINGISAYTRSSYNLLIASNQNAIYDGKLLVH